MRSVIPLYYGIHGVLTVLLYNPVISFQLQRTLLHNSYVIFILYEEGVSYIFNYIDLNV